MEVAGLMLLSFVCGWYFGRAYQGLKTEETYKRLCREAGLKRPGLED